MLTLPLFINSSVQQWHSINKLRIPYQAYYTSCAADSSNQKLYLFGGIRANGGTTNANKTYRLNFDTLSWEYVVDMPHGGHQFRGDMRTSQNGDSTYWYIGVVTDASGFNSGPDPEGTTWYFNLTDETWHDLSNDTSVSLIPSLASGSCIAYDNKRDIFYVIGSSRRNTLSFANYTFIFNYTTYNNNNNNNNNNGGNKSDVWQTDIDGKNINYTVLEDYNDFPFTEQACLYYNDSLYTFDGDNDDEDSEEGVYRLDCNNAIWEKIDEDNEMGMDDESITRIGAIARIWNNYGYLVGGRGRPFDGTSRVFDFTTKEINTIDAELNEAATGVAQCVWDDDTLIAWGGVDDVNDVEDYFDNFQILGGLCVSVIFSVVVGCLTFSSF